MEERAIGGRYAAEDWVLELPSLDHGTMDECQDDCGDFGIRIDRTGRWFYHGTSIPRKEMVCLFATMLSRAEDGSYWLVAPGERGRIEVEDVPFLAVEMFTSGAGRDLVVSFRTNVDELVTVDTGHPLRIDIDQATGDPIPYVHVRDGLEARLTRAVYYELVALGWEEKVGGEELYGLWSSGTFFPLGRVDLSD